ncbi:phenol hydroxylase subunit [Acidocella aromatica]|uniref:Phenol hydroxylase P0 protein n=1 Tax=Acidocella aromatica TaxID=1303579 RepID=A0A840VEU8_9PROT|nr:phenol hydroxylase subunit [Acidocella aromatica]MBB5374284.1 phenol hydroxylase P0 protein [Acidocella aromatica]
MASRNPPVAEPPQGAVESAYAFVRVLGTRSGRFVEFEFGIGSDDLKVELILPFQAFKEFCQERHAEILPPAEGVATELDRLAWRAGQPGLLRQPDKN